MNNHNTQTPNMDGAVAVAESDLHETKGPWTTFRPNAGKLGTLLFTAPSAQY